jgi:hypothetical protein
MGAQMLEGLPYLETINADGTRSFKLSVPATGFPAPPAGYKVAWQKRFADYPTLAAFQSDFFVWAGQASSSPWTVWGQAMLRCDANGLHGHAQSEGANVRTFGFGRKVGYLPPTIVRVHCRRPAFAGLKRNDGIFWATDGKEPQEGEVDSAEDDGTATSLDINLHIGNTWPSLVGSAHLGGIRTDLWGVMEMQVTPTFAKTTWTPDGGSPSSVTLSHAIPATSHHCDIQVEALRANLGLPAGGLDFDFDWWAEYIPA